MSSEGGSAARRSISAAAATLATVAAGPQRPLQHMETIKHVRWMLDQAEALLADTAYREGASFAEIGRARGTTRQNERKAWTLRIEARKKLDDDRQWGFPDQRLAQLKERDQRQRHRAG